MKLDNVLVVYKRKDKTGALRAVRSVLSNNKISFAAVERSKIKKIKGYDLVVVVGGDGTFLRTAHWVGDILMVGVNSSPKTSEGFFMRYNKDNFFGVVKKILKNKAKIVNLMRLKAKINNKQVKMLALNDFYVGCKEAYKTARYTIKIKGKTEWQRSSGVLASTPAGTNAWLGSAGGKKLKLTSKSFSFLVREPYRGRLIHPRITSGIVPNGKALTVISDMFSGVLAVDGVAEIPIKQHDRVMISTAKPLKFVF
jgi:NAD+ kinase